MSEHYLGCNLTHDSMRSICAVHAPYPGHNSEREIEEHLANAHLIAAAPELLEALKRAAPWLGKMIADGAHMNSVLPKDCERTLQMIEAAIAKAEGREP